MTHLISLLAVLMAVTAAPAQEGAKQILAKEGFDPVYGARPLKRAIQRLIQDPLALKVLEGEFSEGDTIEIGAGPADQLTFSKKTARVKSKVMPAHA